jgi:predicted nucleotidyltransferase
MFYQRLFAALAEHRVRYLLVGGLAVNIHGIPRMTMDVDVIIALDPQNVDHFIAAAEELGLHPVLPVRLAELGDPAKRKEWVEQRNLIAFAPRGGEAAVPTVDLMLGVEPQFEPAYRRRVVRDLDGIAIDVASIPDLIAMKGKSGREQDRYDIEHLRKLES